MTDKPSIELRGVQVRSSDRLLLDVPSLALPARTQLAVMGPNGAGKSTLLQVVALLRRPDTGEVWIEGELAMRGNARRLRARMSMLFQSPLLFDTSVLSNAASGLRFHGVGRGEAERRAKEWLDRFGVGHLATRNTRDLSGGEARRVSLARAFAIEPAILLLDEPFAGLDAETRASLIPELAERMRETGVTTLLVTHDAAEATILTTSRLTLRAGRFEP
jgi:tungstate transport system ATP-binding protein